MNPQPWDAALLSRIAHIHLQARRAVAGWQAGVHRRPSQQQHRVCRLTGMARVTHSTHRLAGRGPVGQPSRRHEAESRRCAHRTGRQRRSGTGERGEVGGGGDGGGNPGCVRQCKADRVGLDVVGGNGVEHTNSSRASLLPAIMRISRRSSRAVRPTCRNLRAPQPTDRSPKHLHRISDLMEEPAEWRSAGTAVKRGVDVRILHIHDPAEWTLDFSGRSASSRRRMTLTCARSGRRACSDACSGGWIPR